MKILLLSVGRPRDPEATALHERYAKRIRRFGVDYAEEWVPEERAGGRYSDEHVREREGRALVERLDRFGRAIALDRAGRAFSSETLASRLERWATPRLTLVIGGPLGLHRNVIERVERSWSLSSLTLPHELARVVVAEQIYRSLTLLRGLPYHK